MNKDRIGLNSVQLPLKIHPTVEHFKKTMKVLYTLSIGFQYFLFYPCWWERRLTEFDRTVSDNITGLTDWHLRTLKFFVCSLNILNKSGKHFLPFHDSFLGLEAQIYFDFHLEKNTYLLPVLRLVRSRSLTRNNWKSKVKWNNFLLDLFRAFLCLLF